MFLGRRQRSREESPEWICESTCRQVSVRFTCICGIFFALKPFHNYSLCSVCILLSVCSLHFTLSLHLVRSLQSAVRSLCFTLTDNICHVRLCDICSEQNRTEQNMLYNICHVMLYNICYVMLCYIT